MCDHMFFLNTIFVEFLFRPFANILATFGHSLKLSLVITPTLISVLSWYNTEVTYCFTNAKISLGKAVFKLHIPVRQQDNFVLYRIKNGLIDYQSILFFISLFLIFQNTLGFRRLIFSLFARFMEYIAPAMWNEIMEEQDDFIWHI